MQIVMEGSRASSVFVLHNSKKNSIINFPFQLPNKRKQGNENWNFLVMQVALLERLKKITSRAKNAWQLQDDLHSAFSVKEFVLSKYLHFPQPLAKAVDVFEKQKL